MGKGIAETFKELFGGVDELMAQRKNVGDVAVLDDNGRYIYYLVTKFKYHNKPTYSSLRSSLEAMRKHCLENKVTNISMPMIGCGLDKLKWDIVYNILGDVFKDTGLTITVYIL